MRVWKICFDGDNWFITKDEQEARDTYEGLVENEGRNPSIEELEMTPEDYAALPEFDDAAW